MKRTIVFLSLLSPAAELGPIIKAEGDVLEDLAVGRMDPPRAHHGGVDLGIAWQAGDFTPKPGQKGDGTGADGLLAAQNKPVRNPVDRSDLEFHAVAGQGRPDEIKRAVSVPEGE